MSARSNKMKSTSTSFLCWSIYLVALSIGVRASSQYPYQANVVEGSNGDLGLEYEPYPTNAVARPSAAPRQKPADLHYEVSPHGFGSAPPSDFRPSPGESRPPCAQPACQAELSAINQDANGQDSVAAAKETDSLIAISTRLAGDAIPATIRAPADLSDGRTKGILLPRGSKEIIHPAPVSVSSKGGSIPTIMSGVVSGIGSTLIISSIPARATLTSTQSDLGCLASSIPLRIVTTTVATVTLLPGMTESWTATLLVPCINISVVGSEAPTLVPGPAGKSDHSNKETTNILPPITNPPITATTLSKTSSHTRTETSTSSASAKDEAPSDSKKAPENDRSTTSGQITGSALKQRDDLRRDPPPPPADNTTTTSSSTGAAAAEATIKVTVFVYPRQTTPNYSQNGNPAGATQTAAPNSGSSSSTAASTSAPGPAAASTTAPSITPPPPHPLGYYIFSGIGGIPQETQSADPPGQSTLYFNQVPVVWQSNSMVIGPSTYALDGQSMSTVAVDGNIFTLLPSGQGVVAPGGMTIPANAPFASITAPPAVVTLDGLGISADASNPNILWIAGSSMARVTSGSATVVVDGETYTLGPSSIAADGSTVALPAAESPTWNQGIGSAWFGGTVDNVPFEIDQTEAVIAGSTYAVGPGAAQTTINVDGKSVSLGSEGIAFPETTVPPLPPGMFVPDGMVMTLSTNGAIMAFDASDVVIDGTTYNYNTSTNVPLGDGAASVSIGPQGVVMFETLMALPTDVDQAQIQSINSSLPSYSTLSTGSPQQTAGQAKQTSDATGNLARAHSSLAKFAAGFCMIIGGLLI